LPKQLWVVSRLQETALRECGVPLTIRWGIIKQASIKLHFGINNTFDRPWSVEIDGIYVVVENPANASLDAEALQRCDNHALP
jgi:hypothetical protein